MDNANTPQQSNIGLDILDLDANGSTLILRFLAMCLTKAETALDSETPADRALLSHPFVKGRMAYWRHVCAGIKWCGYLAASKRLDLGDEGDPALNEKVEKWMNGLLT